MFSDSVVVADYTRKCSYRCKYIVTCIPLFMYITHRHPTYCKNTTDCHLLQYIPGMETMPLFPFRDVTDTNQSYPVQLLWLWLAVTESFQTGFQPHRYKFLHHWPTNLEGKTNKQKWKMRLQQLKWYWEVCNTQTPYPFSFHFKYSLFARSFLLSPSRETMTI